MPNALRSHRKSPDFNARQRLRANTNYVGNRPTGFFPCFHAVVADLPRVASSAAGRALLLLFLDASLGRLVDEKKPYEQETTELSTGDLAELACCDQRTIQREIADLARRKVIEVHQPRKGWYVVRCLYRTWDKLPDDKPGPVEQPTDEDKLEPETETAPATKATETVHITPEPIRVPAGRCSRRLAIDCGVRDLQFRSDLDVRFLAQVSAGSLLISIKPGAVQPEINNLADNLRRGRRVSESKPLKTKKTGNERKNSETSVAVKHPRADELSLIFDPQTKGSFSGSPYFMQACEAIQDTPTDYLAEYLETRGGRLIQPHHVPGICRDAKAAWEKWRALPEDQRRRKPAGSAKAENLLRLTEALRRGGRG